MLHSSTCVDVCSPTSFSALGAQQQRTRTAAPVTGKVSLIMLGLMRVSVPFANLKAQNLTSATHGVLQPIVQCFFGDGEGFTYHLH